MSFDVQQTVKTLNLLTEIPEQMILKNKNWKDAVLSALPISRFLYNADVVSCFKLLYIRASSSLLSLQSTIHYNVGIDKVTPLLFRSQTNQKTNVPPILYDLFLWEMQIWGLFVLMFCRIVSNPKHINFLSKIRKSVETKCWEQHPRNIYQKDFLRCRNELLYVLLMITFCWNFAVFNLMHNNINLCFNPCKPQKDTFKITVFLPLWGVLSLAMQNKRKLSINKNNN